MTIENCRPVRAVLHTEWQHWRVQEEVSSPSVISGQSLVSPQLCHYFHFHRHIDCILEKVNWSSLVFLRHSGPQPGRASISQILFRKQYFGNRFFKSFLPKEFFLLLNLLLQNLSSSVCGLLQSPPQPSSLLKVFQQKDNFKQNVFPSCFSQVWVECLWWEVCTDGSPSGEFHILGTPRLR